jgi:hypothetical protein
MASALAEPRDFFALSQQEQWQAHLDAGRISGNPPYSPEVAARREANEALLRRVYGR